MTNHLPVTLSLYAGIFTISFSIHHFQSVSLFWLEEEKDYIYLGDDITWLREQIAKGNAVVRLTKQGQPAPFLADIRYVLELTPEQWKQLKKAPTEDDYIFYIDSYGSKNK